MQTPQTFVTTLDDKDAFEIAKANHRNLQSVQDRWEQRDRHLRREVGFDMRHREPVQSEGSAMHYLASEVNTVVGPLVQAALEASPSDPKSWAIAELSGDAKTASALAGGQGSEGERPMAERVAALDEVLSPAVVKATRERPADIKGFLLAELQES